MPANSKFKDDIELKIHVREAMNTWVWYIFKKKSFHARNRAGVITRDALYDKESRN
jgi:hypothetical protein